MAMQIAVWFLSELFNITMKLVALTSLQRLENDAAGVK